MTSLKIILEWSVGLSAKLPTLHLRELGLEVLWFNFQFRLAANVYPRRQQVDGSSCWVQSPTWIVWKDSSGFWFQPAPVVQYYGHLRSEQQMGLTLIFLSHALQPQLRKQTKKDRWSLFIIIQPSLFMSVRYYTFTSNTYICILIHIC